VEKLKCQVLGCTAPAKYGLYRTNPNSEKEWLHVCKLHEGVIGSDNLRRAGGYYEPKKLKGVNR